MYTLPITHACAVHLRLVLQSAGPEQGRQSAKWGQSNFMLSAGVRLEHRELCELQLPRQPFQLRGNACGGGSGLLAAYTLTDLPMALPGAVTPVPPVKDEQDLHVLTCDGAA